MPPPNRCDTHTHSERGHPSFFVAVSGEWEGCCISINGTSGSKLELPELYVPEAYREWGKKVYDWQTQTSCLVRDGTFRRLCKRLMPTVGCEADAVAFEEDSASVPLDLTGPLIPGADGSYVLAPLALSSLNSLKVVMEHCLPCDVSSSGTSDTAMQSRFRVEHELRNWTTKPLGWSLDRVHVYHEEYEGPFNGGTELFACGAGSRLLSNKRTTQKDDLFGATSSSSSSSTSTSSLWSIDRRELYERSAGGSSSPHPSMVLTSSETAGVTSVWSDEEQQGLLLLPGGVYSMFAVDKEAKTMTIVAGMVEAAGSMQTIPFPPEEGEENEEGGSLHGPLKMTISRRVYQLEEKMNDGDDNDAYLLRQEFLWLSRDSV